MIREFLTFLTNLPAYQKSQTFKHLSQSVSLISRENRCKKYWKSHREESKKTILSVLNFAKHTDSILIFGPGPMHEIPIKKLSLHFKKVVLVDVVHLWETKFKYKNLKNLEFITHDISELEDTFENEIKRSSKLTNKLPNRFLEHDWGLVISANLMSQIPLHFEEFIEKKYSHLFNYEAKEKFYQKLTYDHYAYLKAFKSPCLLITDTQADFYDQNNQVIQSDKNYSHLKLPQSFKSWNWEVAPIPEFQKDVGITMKVEAFILNLQPNSH